MGDKHSAKSRRLRLEYLLCRVPYPWAWHGVALSLLLGSAARRIKYRFPDFGVRPVWESV